MIILTYNQGGNLRPSGSVEEQEERSAAKMYIAMTPELCNALVMDEKVRAELDKLKELIINAIPVEQIYLFGSYAYGTPHKYSDLDLYVVLKDDVPMRDLDAGLQIRMAIARKKSMPVDILAKKKRDFDKRLEDITLERIVNRDGIRIYG
jgi:predicted nucleotidyltransferase